MADLQKVLAQIIAHAWADDAWQGRLSAAGDDRQQIDAVLREKDMELPELPKFSGKIQFVVNNDDIRYVVIPTRPKLTDEDVSVFVQLRQVETFICDCFGGTAHLVEQIKKLILGK
jgi:hypothetical protein